MDELGRVGTLRSCDRGAVLLGSLTRWLLSFVIVCVVAFDGLSMATASVRVHDDATNAARIGNEAYQNSSSAVAAIRAVESFVLTTADQLISVRVLPGTHHAVEVTLARKTPTIVAGAIPPLRADTRPLATVIATDAIS